jgi:micrococcal nuclease
MIAKGYAITYFYAPNERYKNEFLSLEKEAEELQSGLWGIKGIFQPREIAIGQNEEIIPWQRADKYYGKIKTVEGTIVATHNTGKVCFLNFHKDWKRHFTAVIFASDFDKFPSPPEKLYLNKRVQIKGLIKEYRGKPEIIVKSHSQIKILE